MTEQPTVTDGAAAPIAEPTTITTWRDSIDVDPLAADMPPISPEDLAELVADIKKEAAYDSR
jgi:hypothetical protein